MWRGTPWLDRQIVYVIHTPCSLRPQLLPYGRSWSWEPSVYGRSNYFSKILPKVLAPSCDLPTVWGPFLAQSRSTC